MEQVTTNKKARTQKLILNQKANAKIEMWLNQLSKWQTVVRLSKSELVSFIVNSYSDVLSPKDEKELLKALVMCEDVPKERKPRQKKQLKPQPASVPEA
jgi:hypothetical protein